MKIKALYLVLCLVGSVLPLTQFVPWVLANGLDISLFVEELFSSRIGGFFGLDVLVSACVLFIFIAIETHRLKISYAWTAVAATLCVGVSLGFPLFLFLRQDAIERANT